MPLDGLTLGFLAKELQTLQNGRIDKVNQPEKDMIVLSIRANNQNEKLLISASPSLTRIHLTKDTFQNPPNAPMFCMLLRKHLLGGRVKEISQIKGDRLLQIVIESRDELGETTEKTLYFEAMGRHSNLTLVLHGKILDAIRHVSFDMSRVRCLLPGVPYELPPFQDKICPENVTEQNIYDRLKEEKGALHKALLGAVSGLSPLVSKEIAFRLTGNQESYVEDLNMQAFSAHAHTFFSSLDKLFAPVLLKTQAGAVQDFLPFEYKMYDENLQVSAPSLSSAMDTFYSGRDVCDRIAQKSASLKKLLKTHLERNQKKLSLQEADILNSENADKLRLQGELLSAQLYMVQKGAERVTVQNFYDEQNAPLEILLDKTLSPAQNAQKYFKKYKKALAAKKTATEQKEKTLEEIEIIENALFELPLSQTEKDLKDIRETLEEAHIVKKERAKKTNKKEPLSKPYTFYSSNGFKMEVGKNSLQNERLTKSASPNDLWLHAKDIQGAHVIISLEGNEVDENTLLQGAQLAAFYSKAHGVSVPVDYVCRRYVKKPQGAPAGFFIFTNNKTLLVSATEQEIEKLKENKPAQENQKSI